MPTPVRIRPCTITLLYVTTHGILGLHFWTYWLVNAHNDALAEAVDNTVM